MAVSVQVAPLLKVPAPETVPPLDGLAVAVMVYLRTKLAVRLREELTVKV